MGDPLDSILDELTEIHDTGDQDQLEHRVQILEFATCENPNRGKASPTRRKLQERVNEAIAFAYGTFDDANRHHGGRTLRAIPNRERLRRVWPATWLHHQRHRRIGATRPATTANSGTTK